MTRNLFDAWRWSVAWHRARAVFRWGRHVTWGVRLYGIVSVFQGED